MIFRNKSQIQIQFFQPNFNVLIKEKAYEFEKETCRREKQRFNIPMVRAEELQ